MTPAMAETPEDIESIESFLIWVDEQGYVYTVAENWITDFPPEDQESLCRYKPLEIPKIGVRRVPTLVVNGLPTARQTSETTRMQS